MPPRPKRPLKQLDGDYRFAGGLADYRFAEIRLADYPTNDIFLLARFPSNQFTQSPTIRVSAYPVAKICHVRLPGRPNFSSRLPGG